MTYCINPRFQNPNLLYVLRNHK
uniref:Uncharacterized protein n=1 Tax=Anguilla anguilla TaxID=7936 RepID=A0A0E9RRX9_ANGAN